MLIDENEWKQRYRPRSVPWGEDGDVFLERQNPASEPLAQSVTNEYVWTEFLDYSFDDDDHSLISNGFVPSSQDSRQELLGWYICEIPWTDVTKKDGDVFVQVEW